MSRETQPKPSPATPVIGGIAIRRPRALKVGFVPLNDCAPLVVAKEMGLYRKYGLDVSLSRELGWASIRDKVLYDELDAAQAVAGLPYSTSFGLGSAAVECHAILVLSRQGNAVTLSSRLKEQGVRDSKTLAAVAHAVRSERKLAFGVVSLYSSHNFLIRQWLSKGGLDPDRDVQIAVLPPPQVSLNLKAGNLDGYCVGEPWNTIAIREGHGFPVATSRSLSPGHPEKVLMTKADFANNRREEAVALSAAVMEACEFCDDIGNWEEIAKILSRHEYIGLPANLIHASLKGSFDLLGGEERAPFHVFHFGAANNPCPETSSWVLNSFRNAISETDRSKIRPNVSRRIYRADIYRDALESVRVGAGIEEMEAVVAA